MSELTKPDVAPTAGERTLWLPETLCLDNGGTKPLAPPVAGVIVTDEAEWDDDIGSIGFAGGQPWLTEAGKGRTLYYRLEAQVLAARDFIAHELAVERTQASGFNFLPVAMAIGIVLYYSAPAEPSFWMLVATAGLVVPTAFFGRFRLAAGRGFSIAILCGLAMLFAGMLLSALELRRHAMPVPRADITAKLSGTILATDLNHRGAPRYLIEPLAIEGLGSSELPARIRVSGNSSAPHDATGSVISGLARLRPLPAPYYPGGYDFAYHGWLDGVGLTGFFMGRTERSNVHGAEPGWRTRIAIFQNRIREKIANRIRNGLDGQAGHVAVALITGDRSGLSEQTQENLRRSGLAHILAISGLHMALVTLTVIWLVRQGLVLVPGLAERHATKKWAIGAGFAAATLYLLLAGASVATQRAWIMLSVMMLAAMLDRQALTMRSVAIAALVVLAIAPSSLFQPGFQMSFAAVAALVAAYRQWTDWQNRAEHQWQAPGIVRRIGSYFAGLTATSLIAGAATALFAAWHFHRIVPLGIAANLMAMPVVSLAVMPLGLLTMLLMPYGLEALALKPLGWAIDAVLAISQRVVEYHPGLETGLLPVHMPLFGTLGLLFLCGMRSRLRLTGILPLLLIAAIAAFRTPVSAMPDLLIAQGGRTIAVRQATEEGEKTGLALINPRANRFVTEIWRRAYLPNGDFSIFVADGGCGRDICRFKAAGKQVSLVYNPDLLAGECRRAGILLAPRLWFVRCHGRKPDLIITRGDLEQAGSHAIFIDGEHLRAVTTWPSQGDVSAGIRQFAWQQRFDNVSRRLARNTSP